MTPEIMDALNYAAFGFFFMGALGGLWFLVVRLVHGPCSHTVELTQDDEEIQDVGDPRLIPTQTQEWWK